LERSVNWCGGQLRSTYVADFVQLKKSADLADFVQARPAHLVNFAQPRSADLADLHWKPASRGDFLREFVNYGDS